MNFITPLLVYGVPLAAIFDTATWVVHHDDLCEASQRDHYRSAYGLSLERMFIGSPVEHAEVLQVRDSLRSGEIVTVHYVIRWDLIPPKITIQFIRAF